MIFLYKLKNSNCKDIMSFKEVTQLRKAGKLKEALEMAEQDLYGDPDGEWPKKAIVWVYYAYMKKALEKNDLKKIIAQIQNIRNLNLPGSEKMVFDSIAWAVGKYLFAVENAYEEILDRFFELIKDLPFNKPGYAYSFLLKAFNKHSARWTRFIEFMEWWGLDQFTPEDYDNFITESGRKLPSAVESVYISISKRLLAPPRDNKAIGRFIPRIAKIAQEHKNMQYPPYYYAKLLLALGDKEHFMEAFLPFARKKKNEFWVWDLMSEAYGEESPEYFSCLCKSLSCGAPAKFTINVKEKLAKVFEKNGRFPEAKREYNDIIEARNAEGWMLTDKHISWQTTPWWEATKATRDNFDIYNAHKESAEQLLFADKPGTLIVTDTVNKEKTVLSFVASKTLYGFIHYGNPELDPEPGIVFSVRFKEQEKSNKSNFHRVYSIHKTDQTVPNDISKTVSGTIQLRPGNSFGFIGKVFIPPALVSASGLKDGQEVKVVAVISFNKKKKEWGWKGVKVV